MDHLYRGPHVGLKEQENWRNRILMPLIIIILNSLSLGKILLPKLDFE